MRNKGSVDPVDPKYGRLRERERPFCGNIFSANVRCGCGSAYGPGTGRNTGKMVFRDVLSKTLTHFQNFGGAEIHFHPTGTDRPGPPWRIQIVDRVSFAG